MLTHGYVADDLVKVVLVPMVKSKTGDVTSIDNYRPRTGGDKAPYMPIFWKKN